MAKKSVTVNQEAKRSIFYNPDDLTTINIHDEDTNELLFVFKLRKLPPSQKLKLLQQHVSVNQLGMQIDLSSYYIKSLAKMIVESPEGAPLTEEQVGMLSDEVFDALSGQVTLPLMSMSAAYGETVKKA